MRTPRKTTTHPRHRALLNFEQLEDRHLLSAGVLSASIKVPAFAPAASAPVTNSITANFVPTAPSAANSSTSTTSFLVVQFSNLPGFALVLVSTPTSTSSAAGSNTGQAAAMGQGQASAATSSSSSNATATPTQENTANRGNTTQVQTVFVFVEAAQPIVPVTQTPDNNALAANANLIALNQLNITAALAKTQAISAPSDTLLNKGTEGPAAYLGDIPGITAPAWQVILGSPVVRATPDGRLAPPAFDLFTTEHKTPAPFDLGKDKEALMSDDAVKSLLQVAGNKADVAAPRAEAERELVPAPVKSRAAMLESEENEVRTALNLAELRKTVEGLLMEREVLNDIGDCAAAVGLLAAGLVTEELRDRQEERANGEYRMNCTVR